MRLCRPASVGAQRIAAQTAPQCSPRRQSQTPRPDKSRSAQRSRRDQGIRSQSPQQRGSASPAQTRKIPRRQTHAPGPAAAAAESPWPGTLLPRRSPKRACQSAIAESSRLSSTSKSCREPRRSAARIRQPKRQSVRQTAASPTRRICCGSASVAENKSIRTSNDI